MLPRKTKADKKWILNLNNYRNTHPKVLNDCKVLYKEQVEAALKASGWNGERFERANITLVYFHGNKRRIDKSNPCSIIEKFACDALTELGVWDDDDSEHVPETRFVWGGVNSENPFCQMVVEEV